MQSPEYDDEYSTCEKTYSTLRVYHESIPPSEVTRRLGIEPDESLTKGQVRTKRKIPVKINAWLFGTKDKLTSRDSRRHIDWLIDQIYPKIDVIDQMIAEGFEIDIFSYWISKHGHGGPTVSPHQMRRLADLGIMVSWDVYFNGD